MAASRINHQREPYRCDAKREKAGLGQLRQCALEIAPVDQRSEQEHAAGQDPARLSDGTDENPLMGGRMLSGMRSDQQRAGGECSRHPKNNYDRADMPRFLSRR